ncbi:MAG: NAD(P)-dependent oxidoreductase [Anaerococcus vaginalis]|uniref:precorrin-2 dehydrogenase/sirohydrochlorin ferrochelatase family protein n=1 Tax=Anaerococcus vaginalis TaxID=33037 RepID=UPI0029143BF6|nr:NAD(P)-dependent oxidoreductase [Anaerococcus vaginalis]MDU4446681.1 NAD(P)-dependent oxidoreductase [Anaerococcus vaginalis]MDU6181426.1 NAD(P)-dependent oxidoreductase [Anaerococcus vaginalis]MDU7432573.1 NAD(P)-dependent oxidoreductase [Anaerococcus vaginalis]
MRYFPISIDSKDKICLFLGGGKICKRKIESLLRGDFSFLIYGKEIDKEVIKLYKENPQRIKIVEKNIDENFIFPPCDFLFLATGDRNLNKVLRKKAKSQGLRTLDLSDSFASDFHLRKNISNEFINISISSNGQIPIFSSIIGDDLEKYLENLDMEKIKLMVKIRDKLRENGIYNKELLLDLYKEDKEILKKYLEKI